MKGRRVPTVLYPRPQAGGALSYDTHLPTGKKSALLSTPSTSFKGARPVPNNQSSHAWISRFCARLIQLQPALSLGAAVRRAVTIYPHSGDLEPEHAARLAAAARTSSGTVHVGPTSSMRYRPVPLTARSSASVSRR